MVRRQTTGTAEVLRGEGRAVRPDPFHLPARVDYRGLARAGYTDQTAVIGPEGVMIRRITGAGVPLYVSVPLSAYRGIVLAVEEEGGLERFTLRLDHASRELAVPLLEAADTDDIVADWQAWGRMLARPLFLEEPDGELRAPHERLGGLVVKRPRARRVNRFFAERRPKMLCRRKPGGPARGPVHRETEIIARDTTD